MKHFFNILSFSFNFDFLLVDIMCHMPAVCEEKSIPYVYTPSRLELGHSLGLKRTSLMVLVKEHADYKSLYDALAEELKALPMPVWIVILSNWDIDFHQIKKKNSQEPFVLSNYFIFTPLHLFPQLHFLVITDKGQKDDLSGGDDKKTSVPDNQVAHSQMGTALQGDIDGAHE